MSRLEDGKVIGEEVKIYEGVVDDIYKELKMSTENTKEVSNSDLSHGITSEATSEKTSEVTSEKTSEIQNDIELFGRILREYDLRLPTDEELSKCDIKDGLPSTTTSDDINNSNTIVSCNGRVLNLEALQSGKMSMPQKDKVKEAFKDYLKKCSIPHQEDNDNGAVRYTFVFKAPNAPGYHVESCIWFYEKEAEVRTYYTEMGANICKKSENKAELYRLLNYINATVL